jgi:hypothetical protein
MYAIEITVHNCETDVDATETLYGKSLYHAVANAYRAEARIGLAGFVSIKYQSTDCSGFVCLERLDWFEYLPVSAQVTLGA